MTQYADIVEKRRLHLEALEWAGKIKWMQTFDTTQMCMWYDTRREDGGVMDVGYNDGTIVRKILRGPNEGQEIVMEEGVTGEDLVWKYTRGS